MVEVKSKTIEESIHTKLDWILERPHSLSSNPKTGTELILFKQVLVC